MLSPHTPKKSSLCEGMGVLADLIVVIILQYIQVSIQHIYTPYIYICYRSIISQQICAIKKKPPKMVKIIMVLGLCSAASMINTLQQSAAAQDQTSCRQGSVSRLLSAQQFDEPDSHSALMFSGVRGELSLQDNHMHAHILV